MRAARIRIGWIRPKSGGRFRVLPSLKQRIADNALEIFRQHVNYVNEMYADDLSGYILIPWNATGQHNVYLYVADGNNMRPNNLPSWAAEAIRRELCERDTRSYVRRTLGYDD